ncbi:MAG: endonuclease/exonuclease/phosphatase family protein [Bacteroidales bacterium]|nr:endonuclease/exonuclease/phosphatase family protein [Bacteroidales bacterium]
MHKTVLTIVLLVITQVGLFAQVSVKHYAVGFYNQENLFDTIHDVGKNDNQFLPDGTYKWNTEKYLAKLENMSKALADMGTDKVAEGCAFIGLSEIENRNVLNDLIAQKPLKDRGIQFVHEEGPDKRGIDCALLYNPQIFSVTNYKLISYIYENDSDKNKATRGFLTVRGLLSGEDVAVVVCHLPSRYSTGYYRELGARQMKAIKDSLQRDNAGIKLFFMGDMNDDPHDKSMSEVLGGRREIATVEPSGLYNPWWNILFAGAGTHFYRNERNLFDQIIISENMLDKPHVEYITKRNKTSTKITEHDKSKLTYSGSEIFKRDYLLNQEGKYKGTPKRTTAGGNWLNGYSDHLPVVLYLSKVNN